MFLLLGTLLAVAGTSEPTAERMHAAFGPALDFIHHYMALFYSPLLITLPQNARSLIGDMTNHHTAGLGGARRMAWCSRGPHLRHGAC